MTYISADRRKKSATVKVKEKGGKTEEKYPIDSVQTAKSAVRLRNNARPPLTASQKKTMLAKAAKYGVHPADDKKKKASKKAEK